MKLDDACVLVKEIHHRFDVDITLQVFKETQPTIKLRISRLNVGQTHGLRQLIENWRGIVVMASLDFWYVQ